MIEVKNTERIDLQPIFTRQDQNRNRGEKRAEERHLISIDGRRFYEKPAGAPKQNRQQYKDYRRNSVCFHAKFYT